MLQKRNEFNKNIFSLLCSFVMITVYFFIEVLLKCEFNSINMLLVFISTFFGGQAVWDIHEKGVNLSNVYVICFFGALLLNNLNISGLQKEKKIIDLYYFLFGPVIFLNILKLPEHLKIKIFKKACLNGDFICLILTILCILCKWDIFKQTGIRLISNSWLSTQSNVFIIPGRSGIANMLMWLTVMMFPIAKKKWIKILMAVVPVLCCVLSAKRGDLMRIFIFYGIYWMGSYGKYFLTKRNFTRLIIIIFIMLISFGLIGNFRQKKRGWTTTTIGTLLESKINNDIVNWTYGYTAINFDVLKQEYIDQDKNIEFKALLVPMMRLFEGNEAVENYYESYSTNGLNGFNAATFLGDFIRELGVFYFIDVVLLGLIVAGLDILCSISGFKGGHILLIMMVALTCFGNYILNVNLFFTLIVGVILCFIIPIADVGSSAK